MVQITKFCNELKRANVITECGAFHMKINDRIIKTKKSSAICFSDLIKEKYFIDKSITSMETHLDIICQDSIDIVLNFIETGKLEFSGDESHLHDIFEIGKYFGNQLLTQIYCEHVKSDESLTNENVFKKYEIFAFENDSTAMNECIEYISSHFYCLNEEEIIRNFVKNGFEFCEKILTSKQLKIENEDKLGFILLEICKMNRSLFDLFGYVKLQFCSSKFFDEIYNFSVENSFESNLLTIYNETLKNYHSNIRDHIEISNKSLISFEKHLIQNKLKMTDQSISFEYAPIIVERKIVEKVSKEIQMEMTASSVCSGSLSNINSYLYNDFYTNNVPNSWLKAELKGYQLKPNSYFIRSACCTSNLLRNWKLEGIKEDGTSVVLENNYYNIPLNEIMEFPLQTNYYFVAFKITQTGKNARNDDYFLINVFDFKGELIKI
ncbi:hypothetical protein TVAG_337670 [Trichomonas vaginalis G3]|uniref:BTB domain-containing protein n=1 Tax=Trichomonas vaginalis (strain ATCC PRA-98 / G3) TaxID=412133 RepID=A2EWL3_TRIV3|nr:protein ubiquitination [Trichomonas vaginalis G3]EAY02967.1 hypothetical protein TVAG_337670 [Trichomonas vaginalis G3]KAI5492192.1 protein ubiquitination [Trichomonas vaginalis G3]|eukprot:XP_001315190.1 hypothetical protein [Trichomonas vaginalis G3]